MELADRRVRFGVACWTESSRVVDIADDKSRLVVPVACGHYVEGLHGEEEVLRCEEGEGHDTTEGDFLQKSCHYLACFKEWLYASEATYEKKLPLLPIIHNELLWPVSCACLVQDGKPVLANLQAMRGRARRTTMKGVH